MGLRILPHIDLLYSCLCSAYLSLPVPGFTYSVPGPSSECLAPLGPIYKSPGKIMGLTSGGSGLYPTLQLWPQGVRQGHLQHFGFQKETYFLAGVTSLRERNLWLCELPANCLQDLSDPLQEQISFRAQSLCIAGWDFRSRPTSVFLPASLEFCCVSSLGAATEVSAVYRKLFLL